MLYIRSFLFLVYMYGGTFLLSFFLILLLPFPPKVMRFGSQIWGKMLMWGVRVICGIRYEIRGLENLPESGAIIACKHQSAWDTAIFVVLRLSTCYVLKKELLKIPFYGWFVNRGGHVAVDRAAGASALKGLVADVKAALKEDRNIVIFPEGTRSEPGKTGTYHPGIAAIYTQTNLPVIPVALNSGVFWGRKSFLKKPGTMVLDIMEPIEAGLKRREFMSRLETTIEERTSKLEQEALQQIDEAK